MSAVAQKTTEQANLVGEVAVAGANEVSEKAVGGLESVVASSGLVNPVNTPRITFCVKLITVSIFFRDDFVNNILILICFPRLWLWPG